MDSFEKALKKAEREQTKVTQNCYDMIYYATCLCLHRKYGWDKADIVDFGNKFEDVFIECHSIQDTSLVEMCDKEVGIEFRNPSNQSYKQFPFLNGDAYKAMINDFYKKPLKMQLAWLIRVRDILKGWAFPQIMATVTLALYRKVGWEYDEIVEAVAVIEDITWEYNRNIEQLRLAVLEETGLNYTHIQNGDLALLKERAI